MPGKITGSREVGAVKTLSSFHKHPWSPGSSELHLVVNTVGGILRSDTRFPWELLCFTFLLCVGF